ncbi:PAS domain S-box protein [candidate division CSSED10-310 bacterium]|uniref:histidine kinase n=1 Tax=candidate division CSSED10-310 bacterium TaxID=2855610 RepID=A0ABV6YTW6_UNCC1
MNILLVEDNPRLRDEYAARIKECGQAVVSASSSEALHTLRQSYYSLIIISLNFSEGESLDYIRQIRGIPQTKWSYLLMLFESLPAVDVKALLEAGANDYFLKSLDGQNLKAKLIVIKQHINSLLSQKQLTEQLEKSTAGQEAEKAIQRQYTFEKIIARIATRFVTSPDFEAVITASLEDVGTLDHVSAVHLHLFNKTRTAFEETYGWSSPGIRSPLEHLKASFPQETTWLLKHLEQNKIFNGSDLSTFPDMTPAQKNRLFDQGLQSLLIVPLQVRKKLVGCVCFDNTGTGSAWAEDDVTLLKLLSKIMSRALERDMVAKQLRRLEKAVESMPLGLTITDTNRKIIYLNPADARIHGYSVDELMGQDVRIFNVSQKRPQTDYQEMKQWKGLERESTNIRKDGSIFPVWLMSDVVKDDRGEPIAIVSTCEDITLKKQAQKALQDRVEIETLVSNISTQFINLPLAHLDQATVSALKAISTFLDSDRSYIFQFSDQQDRMTVTHQWCVQEAETLPDPELEISSQTLPWWMEKLKNFETLHIPDVLDLPPAAKAEKLFFQQQQVLSIVAVPLIYRESLLGFLGFDAIRTQKNWLQEDIRLLKIVAEIFANTFDRRNTTLALRESEEKFRMLTETAPMAIFIQQDEEIVYANPAAEKISGYSRAELLAMNYQDLIHPEMRHLAEKQPLTKVSDEIVPFRFQLKINPKSGQVKWIYLSLSLIEFQGKPAVLGTATDITAQKYVEDELRSFNVKLEQKVKERTRELNDALLKEKELHELKSRFVSLVSHEFRTPMTTIASSAEIIKRYHQKLSSEKQIHHLNRITINVDEMTHLLDDVTFIGKAEIGKLSFDPIPLTIQTFCTELVEEMRINSKNKCPITYNNQCSFGEVELDEKLLRHILTNLLSNAIKYSAPGQRIDFSTSNDPKTVMFQVQDYGIGIPLEDQKGLFEAFFRASNVGNIHGSGLGLAIVKRCVDLHEGQIDFSSQPEQGVTMKVSLPLHVSGKNEIP